MTAKENNMSKQYAIATKKPNSQKPENIVFTNEMMKNVKAMAREIAANTDTYRGQLDKQAQTLTIINGIIEFYKKNGSISPKQYESLYDTSKKCYQKGNISSPLPRDDKNLIGTVHEYYHPEEEEMFSNMVDDDKNIEPDYEAISKKELIETMIDLRKQMDEQYDMIKQLNKTLTSIKEVLADHK